MNLLINGLKHDLHAIIERRKLKATVDFKVNKAGALVVAIIVPPEYPNQWRGQGG